MTGEAAPAWLPRSAAKEALALWAICFAAIVATFLTWTAAAKLVATVGFLYLPVLAMRARGEDYPDFGLSARNLGRELRLFGAVSAVVFPAFIGLYVGGMALLPLLPRELVHVFTPYVAAPSFHFRLPDRFAEWVIDQLFVVAIPEEFFYRGYVQSRLRDGWPEGPVVLGARLGRAFWLTAVLFALGHLAIFQVWRLAVFFPALIFGWMRERTGGILGAALFHASANLLVQVLDASFFS